MTVLSFVLSYQCWMWKGGCLLQSPTSHGVAPRKIEYYLPPPSARLLWWRCLLKTALQRSVTQAGERSGWVCWRQILRGMSTLRRLWRATLDFPFAAESPFVLPVADSLAEHAFQFTPFESAASGGAGGDTVEQRLGVFEKSLADIAESLKRMAPSSTTSTRPSALRATPKPASKSAKDQTGRGPQELQSTPLASRVESFDLEVVRSAREAGVPDSQIARMLDIAAKAGRCAPSSPQGQHTVRQRGGRGRGCRGGGASCSNRWQQQGFGFCRVKAHQDCSAACFPPKEGSESRRSARRCWFGSKRQQWSRWLTSSCSSPTSIESSFGEATRRAVQGAGSKSRAGLQCGEPSSWQCFSSSDRQGLLEMRSHVQNFQTPARLLWGVAGALDCMRLQKLVLG